jgi:hypothetical protein
LDKKAIWLAVALGFDSGPRIGNLTKKDGPSGEDHCVRAEDCIFDVLNSEQTGCLQYRAGIGFAQYLKARRGDSSEVKSVTMKYVTHKTQRQLVQTPKYIARRTILESQVLDDICAWIMRSGVQQTDELLTRYSPRRKVVIRKDVANAIKDVAEFFRLPRTNFSTRSLRSGYATDVTVHGVAPRQRNQRGGWKDSSRIPERHYVAPIGNVGTLGIEDDDQFTVSDVRGMAPNLTLS